jgi:hypothetical protein
MNDGNFFGEGMGLCHDGREWLVVGTVSKAQCVGHFQEK